MSPALGMETTDIITFVLAVYSGGWEFRASASEFEAYAIDG